MSEHVPTSALHTLPPAPCIRCGYALAGLPLDGTQATCPECGHAQALEHRCRQCRHVFRDAQHETPARECPHCGSPRSAAADEGPDPLKGRRWLGWSPVVVLPLSLAAAIFAAYLESDIPPILVLGALIWAFGGPVAYEVAGALLRTAQGDRASDPLRVAAVWLTMSILTTMALIALGSLAGAIFGALNH